MRIILRNETLIFLVGESCSCYFFFVASRMTSLTIKGKEKGWNFRVSAIGTCQFHNEAVLFSN